jgi:hypothetical protein
MFEPYRIRNTEWFKLDLPELLFIMWAIGELGVDNTEIRVSVETE